MGVYILEEERMAASMETFERRTGRMYSQAPTLSCNHLALLILLIIIVLPPGLTEITKTA